MRTDDLLVSQPDCGEQALEIADMLVRSGAVDVIVVDSVAALTPRAELEGEMGDAHVGLQARLMSQALRKLTGTISKSNTLVIFINQIRMKIGVMFGNPETTTGGNALKFYASVRLDIRRVGAIKDGEKVVGNRTRVKVVKNKMAPPFREVEFDILYGEGISREGDLVDLGAECGAVEKSGAWFGFDGERIGQGRENAKQFLREHPDVASKIEAKVLAHFAIKRDVGGTSQGGAGTSSGGATVHTLNAAAQAGQREEALTAGRVGYRQILYGASDWRNSLGPVYDRSMASKKAAPEGPVEVPEIISILPLRNSVLFPGSIIPIDVGRKKSVKLVEEAISKERPVIGIVTQRDARTEDPGPGDLYMVGCAARILKVIKLAKDNFSVILQGVSRIRLLEIGGSDPFMTARVQALPDSASTDVELDALVMNVKDVAKRVIKLMPELPKEASALVDSVVEPGQLSDVIISHLDVQVDEKQDVLETFDLKARLRKVLRSCRASTRC